MLILMDDMQLLSNNKNFIREIKDEINNMINKSMYKNI